ncbi:MAG: DUF4160 domain-containing protein [Limisphaerales bacterium]
MPKLYEYFGLVIYFYTNEHEPIHVHGEYQGRECKAELILRNGKIVKIIFSDVAGVPPLEGTKLRDFKKLVKIKGDEIVDRWIDYFVRHIHHKPQVITRKLK